MGDAPTFYLGAHRANWLASAGVPLFVSRRTLVRLKSLPHATTSWALDSGGFTELSMHGAWNTTPQEFVTDVRRYYDEIGSLVWSAPQDWMCEPDMLKRTGLCVEEHQRRTIVNYLELRSLAPELPIIPVLQGWTLGDYLRHADQYEASGVKLAALPLVGVGTVCRRQNTTLPGLLFSLLHADGLRLHGFGLKMQGLRASKHVLESADSMAWSYSGRRNPPLPGHETRHKNCANCIDYALMWRADLLASLDRAH